MKARKEKFLAFAAMMLLSCVLRAAITDGGISPTNRTAWILGTTLGVQGGIPTNKFPVVTNMTLLDTNGVSDCLAAVQNAINTSPWGSQIDLPAGTFRFSGGLGLASGIVLHGAGKNKTILNFDTGHMERQYGGSPSLIYTGNIITNGMTQGSTTVTISTGDTSGYAVNTLAMIARANDTNEFADPLVLGVGGPATNSEYGYTYEIMVLVTGVTSNTISFTPPLYGDMQPMGARIIPDMPAGYWSAVEDMTVNVNDVQAIYLLGTVDSWIKNVRANGWGNHAFHLEQALFCSVVDCDGLGPEGSSPNGAGILCTKVSASLFQNNVIHNVFPSVEFFGGCCGNVVAYNFFLNDNNLMELDGNHYPHDAFNLYEGNICPRFMEDGYYGSSGQNTAFRNWFNGQMQGTTQLGYCYALERFTRNENFIGNVIGSPPPFYFVPGDTGVSYGQPNLGSPYESGTAPPWADWGTWPGATGFQEHDMGVYPTTLIRTNFGWSTVALSNNVDIGPGNTLSNSLYLPNGQPGAWWDTNTLAFPNVNYMNGSVTPNPAMIRWIAITNGSGRGGGNNGNNTGGGNNGGGSTVNLYPRAYFK